MTAGERKNHKGDKAGRHNRVFVVVVVIETMNALWLQAARWYQKKVGSSLSKYGLRYEDIWIEHPDVEKALQYLPKKELVERNRRIKRAMHLSMTHTYLPKEIQAVQTPNKSYLAKRVEEQRLIREERERLNNF